MKKIAGFIIASLLGGAIGAGAIYYGIKQDLKSGVISNAPTNTIQLAKYPTDIVEHPNFISASAIGLPSVVHIKAVFGGSSNTPKSNEYDPFRDFFGQRGPQNVSGSGVIVSADGYILTNNHVVENTNKIEVVLNDKRSYNATIVGTDKNSDLALIKIEPKEDLPFLAYGNSDEIQVGEWVLAVGNPFNLTSTVTAGIVSAKGRNINILGGDMPIESFIQTDAAVNPGNSGGALINVKGELVGINTAIASQTGSYAGYSFAIPVNLAKKIAEDLMKFGNVQRGILGIQIRDVDAQLANDENLKVSNGVYVADFSTAKSAAEESGVQKGDVIVRVDGIIVTNSPGLQEIVSRKRPGDKVKLVVNRKGEEKEFTATLKTPTGSNTTLAEGSNSKSLRGLLGADIDLPSKSERESLKIDGGVKIKNLTNGILSESGVKEGFIVLKVNKITIKSTKQFEELIKKEQENGEGILIEGVYPNGKRSAYGFSTY